MWDGTRTFGRITSSLPLYASTLERHTVVPLAHERSHQADLDADPILRDRPIILYRKDLHAAWVSSKALELTIPNLPDKVEGGKVICDANKKPTGISSLRSVYQLTLRPWNRYLPGSGHAICSCSSLERKQGKWV